MRPPSPLSPSSPYGAPLNETASFIIEKMMSATPETKRYGVCGIKVMPKDMLKFKHKIITVKGILIYLLSYVS